MTKTITSLHTSFFLILLPEVTRSYLPGSSSLTFVSHFYTMHKDTWFSTIKVELYSTYCSITCYLTILWWIRIRNSDWPCGSWQYFIYQFNAGIAVIGHHPLLSAVAISFLRQSFKQTRMPSSSLCSKYDFQPLRFLTLLPKHQHYRCVLSHLATIFFYY